MSTQRSYAGPTDLAAIVALRQACEAVDHLGDTVSVTQLQAEFASPMLDAACDLQLWYDAAGALVGFAHVWRLQRATTFDGLLLYWVAPDARGETLDSQILTWAEQRMRERGEDEGKPHSLHIRLRTTQVDRQAAVVQHGLTLDHYFLVMSCDLTGPLPPVRLPAGFTVREVAGQADGPAWVALYDDAFRDHWNHHILDLADFAHVLNEPGYRADLDLIALVPDGTWAALCANVLAPEEQQRADQRKGIIDLLGTRRQYHRLGLGRALLLGTQRLQLAGATLAELQVDAASLTGATRLFESVGFHTSATVLSYGKPIKEPTV